MRHLDRHLDALGRLIVMTSCVLVAACTVESETPPGPQASDEARMGSNLEDPDAIPSDAIVAKGLNGLISPLEAACGTVAGNLENRLVADAAFTGTARQRTGSSTSCPAPGALQPTDDAIYFCFTFANDGFTWTYLQNVRTGVRGWTRDDLLRDNGSRCVCFQKCSSL